LNQQEKARTTAAAIKAAESNPPPDAQCFLFMMGEQSGPFLPAQIRSMWKAGSITADALFYYPQLPDWRPVKSFCKQTRASGRQVFGVLLTIIGIVTTIYFAGFYDTSVSTERDYIVGVGYVGGGRVVNLSKQQNRLIGVIVGIAISAIGVVMISLPNKPNEA
jgi:hypothetical protein